MDRNWIQRFGYEVTRVVCLSIARIFFRARILHRERSQIEGGLLVCSNHQSYLDPILIGLACDRRLNYLARKSLFRFAPFRWLIEWYDAIPIERDGMYGERLTTLHCERSFHAFCMS